MFSPLDNIYDLFTNYSGKHLIQILMLEAELAGATWKRWRGLLPIFDISINISVDFRGQASVLMLGREKLAVQETSPFLRLDHNPKHIHFAGTFLATRSCQKWTETEGKGGQNCNQLCETLAAWFMLSVQTQSAPVTQGRILMSL